MSQAANFVLFLGGWVLAVVGLFDGVRRLVAHGAKRRAIYEVTACALASIAMGSFYLWACAKEQDLIEGLNKNPYAELPSGWAADLTAEARAKASHSYASAAFMGQGILLKHSDMQGQWVRFQPNQQDIADREKAIVVRTQLEEQSRSFWSLALRWWLGAAIAAMIGYLAGRREKVRNDRGRA